MTRSKGDINISINIMDSKIEGNFFHNQSSTPKNPNMLFYSHRENKKLKNTLNHSKTISNNFKELKYLEKFYMKSSNEKNGSGNRNQKKDKSCTTM